MADAVTCSNKLDLNTILLSLFSNVQSIAGTETVENVGRIVEVTNGRTYPIDCNNKDSLEELFKRALCIANDGYIALRVVNTDYAKGAGLAPAPVCGNPQGLVEILRRCFCIDDNGDVAFNVANIT